MTKRNQTFTLAKLAILFFLMFYITSSCSDELPTESPQNIVLKTRSVTTPYLDWENINFMPTPSGQTPIPSPWIGQGSIASAVGIDIVNDRKASDGWELMYNTFDGTSKAPLINPYFILYNKYRGIMRIFLYTTTQFVESSSYLQDGIAIISNKETSMLNFIGQDFIDATINQKKYSQMQPAPIDGSLPLASNKWYMLQYEIAYDSNISQIPYNYIQLSWYVNYYNVTRIKLEGDLVGKLNGIIGSSSTSGPDIFSPLINAGTTVGTGVLAGIGQDFIKNNGDTETGVNKLGLPKDVFKSLSKGVSSAMSTASGNLPGAIMNILSAIIGGSSGGPTPISFSMNAKITLEGTGTNSGSFPSSPTSLWVPGTNINSSAIGFIPIYNKPLGVVNFSGKPKLEIKVTERYYQVADEPFDADRMIDVRESTGFFPTKIDYSSYLQINPEVLKTAKVEIKQQDLIIKAIDYSVVGGKEILQINPPYIRWIECNNSYINSPLFDNLRFGVRFTIKVSPLNGSSPSIIIKTFALTDVWKY